MQGPFGDHTLGIPYEPVADLLAKYARRDPQKTAIVDLESGTSIAFGALERKAVDIATWLKSRGVGKGDRVLVLADEFIEKLLIWMGVWRIGAVMCPFNLEINEKQMVSLTAALDPKLILYHKDIDVAAMTGEARAPKVRFGAWRADGTNDPKDELFVSLKPGDAASLPERNEASDTACIFCTSGTTARPKIVIYNHAAYWMNGLDTLEFLGLTEDDRTLEYRSFGWNSAQVLSLLPFLQKGLTMHIAKRFSHSRFFEWVQTHGITFSAGVPTVLNMLLNKPLGYTAKDIPSLRLMSCSTAPLTAQQWNQFEEMYGVTLLQLYGMSETGWVCGNRHYAKKMGTVGLPAIHQELKIVDGQGAECPPGAEGEITVGGPQMAIGYLNDDGSIDPVLGKRIKTGDLGIRDDDGFIRVTGRTKDLIIRGGVNIAPLEIDEVLLKHPGVAEAAAVGVPDKIYGEEVICYVVAKSAAGNTAPGGALTEASVLEHCGKFLPPAKTPKQVSIVSELPKSDRGKVLRDKLRDRWITLNNPAK
ncbi:MAG: acyl--CoA ligase [Alphaproteobacteria bacterium]|nr:acyl--CoA ligase [Alphaproteobacteria bacterium]